VRPGLAAIALTVLLPVATLAAPLAWWGRADPPATLAPVAAGMEKAVADNPEVVVLGASKVGTDLDHAALAKAFASAPNQIEPLNLSGTTAPVWYAILKNRVYGTGQKPKLILVYSTFDWVLSAVPSGEAERAVLLSQMGSEEPVLRHKTLGEGTGGADWDRVRRRRTEAHTALMGFVRDAAVGLALAPSEGDDRVAAGAALAAPALEALFGMQANLDLSHSKSAIPIAEAARVEATVSNRLEDTLLPDLLAMAKDNGAQLVFIHAPVRLSSESQYLVEPHLLRDAVQAINAAGAGYMDLRELRLGDAAFGDAAHLNRVGREALTAALVARLQAMGVGGSGPLAPAPLPVVTTPPKVTRTGSPPVLPAATPRRGPRACGWEANIPELRPINDFALQSAGLGMVSPLLLLEDGVALKPHATRDEFDDACKGAFLHQERGVKFSPTGADADAVSTHTYTFGLSEETPLRTAQGGEAWWVYPGTTLTMDFPEGYTGGAGAYGVQVDAVVLGGAAGVPTVRIGAGAEAPLIGVGLHRSASLAATAPTGPWSLSISTPADGGWLLLRRVAHGTAADPRFVVGGPGGSQVGVITADAAYAADPAPLGPLGAPTPGLPGGAAPAGANAVATYDLGGRGLPDTRALWQAASVSGCAPVRVMEDGAALPTLVVRAEEVGKAPGRFTQVGTQLIVTGSDGTAPGANGRTYAAVLEPTRKCRGLRWLYPGDVATFTVKPAVLAPLLADATRVEIGGVAVPTALAEGTPATTAEGTLRIRVGDDVYLDTTFPLANLATTPPAWTLDRPLPRGPEPVILELSIPPDAPYTLFTSLAVSEPGALALGAAPEGPAAADATP
jgi:hypothetical protein